MYTFLLRPRWIVLHLLLAAVVVLCALAGLWQLDRHRQRAERNRDLRAALTREPVDLNELAALGGDAPVAARATGRYDERNGVLLRGRSLRGRTGDHLLTPLVLRPGVAVLVDRGWVEPGRRMRPASSPGRVTVTGLLLPPERKRPLRPDDPATGRLDSVSRIVPSRLDAQVPYRLLTPFLLLAKQEPPARGDGAPVVVPPPEPDPGPHLGYAIQWFSFIGIALVGYAILLRREARRARSS